MPASVFPPEPPRLREFGGRIISDFYHLRKGKEKWENDHPKIYTPFPPASITYSRFRLITPAPYSLVTHSGKGFQSLAPTNKRTNKGKMVVSVMDF
jgi:hypothetical protein